MNSGGRQGHRGAPLPVVGLLALAALACGGASGGRAAQPDGVAGRVVDASGAGVAAAKVWAVGGPWGEPEAVAETTTDGHGAFAFPSLWGGPDRQGSRSRLANSYGLIARDGDGRIGWLTTVYQGGPGAVRIEVVSTSEARGRVVDPTGKPVAGAEIVPALFLRSPAKRSSSDYAQLTPELARPLATTTAKDGSFVLRRVPRGCEIQARVSARGFGTPRVSWDSNAPVTIALDGRLGRIEGRLVPPEAGKFEGEIPVVVHRHPSTGAGFSLLYFRTLRIGGDGRFRFDDLPPGRYSLHAGAEPKTGYQADPIADVDVGPEATVAGVNVPLRRLVKISGRVVDAVSGEGLGGVRVAAALVLGNSLRHVDQVETDARGRYTVHVAPGKAVIQPRSVPKSHLGLDYESCPKLDVAADRDWPEIQLPRAMALEGVVVDGAGKPVEGAEVQVVKPDLMGTVSSRGVTLTAKDGSFRLEQLDPDDTLPVRARTKDAATDGAVVIRPGTVTGKLTLTVDPKNASRVRGIVADQSGKPIPRASIKVWWNRNYVSEKTRLSGVGSVLEADTTDAQGRFASSALWPGDHYKVAVAAEGFGSAESPQVAGRAGEDHDLGTIRLVGTSGHVAGRVVDTAGKPVAGASVFNRGDGPVAVFTQTDPGGMFRLDDLFVGSKFVFARKEGYRFTGVRLEQDSDEVILTLRRVDEAPPPWTPVEPATPEEERALAKRVLTKIWQRYGKDANNNGAFVCVLHMARLDPPLALEWSAQRGGRYDGRVREEAAESLAETDADGALELLTAAGGRPGTYPLIRLAARFAAEDPAKALKFAEEAAVRARAMEQPARASEMARAGALLVRLGRKDAGLALIHEAAEAAARMGLESRSGSARGIVARALAPLDTERALALVEPLKNENDRESYLGYIASALAEVDPERALAVAETLSARSSTPQSVKVGIAYALGSADRLDEAVRVIEGMSGYAVEKYRSEAYAWLAVAVTSRHPGRAADLIDRALQPPVDRPDQFQSWTYYGGGPGVAGSAVACARRAGYPDMAGAVARVLAARSSDGFRDLSTAARTQTIAALILALTDPAAARQMLHTLEERSGLSPAELGKVADADRHWLMAWALADPKHAEDLFEIEFAALEGERNVNLQSTGLLKMAEVLVQPRPRREAFVRGEIGAMWHPGIEE